MPKTVSAPVIRLRGVRHNNLQGFDLDLPQHRLIVITGLSGSGKSSLAFDTLFAEGQRRYIETFSPYARQFFDRMDKPRVDYIEGIPPAIAIEQRNAVRTTRSTVGTMTEICDYLKVLWPHLAQLHCRGCGRLVRQDTPQAVWEQMLTAEAGARKPTEVFVAETGDNSGVARVKIARRSPNEVFVTFEVPLSTKLSLAESLGLLAGQGYQRLLVDGEVVRLEDAGARLAGGQPVATARPCLTVIQDRLRLEPANRSRFIEACEQAYHFGKGRLAVWEWDGQQARWPRFFSNRLHCADCDLEYREPTSALFSFNHPLGACPTCKGFGRIIRIDYDLAIPDRSLTLAEGAVRPWRSGFSAECQADLEKFCRARGVPLNVPFRSLSPEHQHWVIEGDPDYGVDEDHQWPRAWYGVKGYFRWLESRAYKMHVRVLLSRYRAYTPCPECGGRRLQPEALLWRLPLPRPADGASPALQLPPALTLADFYALPVARARAVMDQLAASTPARGLLAASQQTALDEVRARLGYLEEVGLGYLTLDRPTRTLSGGETERVNLTACLGTRLVNTLFVLDEPSVGLHPRDTDRLVRLLQRLRDAGNTVVVVEHEAAVIRAADHLVDLGPGHGETGGHLVFQGTYAELLRCATSLTGQYLSGRRRIELPPRRPVAGGADESSPPPPDGNLPDAISGGRSVGEGATPASDLPWLRLRHVTRHNLRDLAVAIPLERLVCVTGVSGSGKSTLVREVLYPALRERLGAVAEPSPAGERLVEADAEDTEAESAAAGSRLELAGWEALGRVVLVDQSPLGRTPRSNPAVYVGAFDHLRELFAASEAARARGLNASAFSFNSPQGQCQRCRGAGFEKIEMQFLSDVFIRCPECDGRRYRDHVLEVKIRGDALGGPDTGLPTRKAGSNPAVGRPRSRPAPAAAPGADAGWSITDVLEATVEEVCRWLGGFAGSRSARRAAARLQVLQDVGLGYLRLGQPIHTLSGGESQRLKLAAHLADHAEAFGSQDLEGGRQKAEGSRATSLPPDSGPRPHPDTAGRKPTLFLFDEPTTGLHFEDVRGLLQVFQRLVDAGHSVLVIEHNLEVIKCADWVIDLGPEAGDEGGRVLVSGTPETVAACPRSHTGRALAALGLTPSSSAAIGR